MNDRVVHVITGLDIGGAERALFNLLNSLTAKERAACMVISLTSEGVYGPAIQELGIRVEALYIGRNLSALFSAGRLRKLIRQISPTVIVSWMYHANIMAWLASRCMACSPRLIWNIRHSLYSLADERPLTRWVIRAHRWVGNSVWTIVYNSHVSCQQHGAFGIQSQRCMVIANGFDLDRWRPDPNDRGDVRAELHIPAGSPVVGHVARYHPLKDQKVFLEAMRCVMVKNPIVHLILVGRNVDPSNPALADYFDLLPMERVHVLGERFDVERLMRAMDVFCLSSRSEAFPNVIGEAMASGVACVVTDAGDSGYIVGESGRVVPVGDANALAVGIASFVSMKAEFLEHLGMTARLSIEQRFGIGKTAASYRSLILNE